MRRIVADLGNSRLKWAESGADGRVIKVQAAALDSTSSWRHAIEPKPGDLWAVASVNPSAAEALERFLTSSAVSSVRWFRSAADVTLRFGHDLTQPERTGADRGARGF